MALCLYFGMEAVGRHVSRIFPWSLQSVRCRHMKPKIPRTVLEERKRVYREQLLRPYEEMQTLEHRLQGINKNSLKEYQVDIGLPSRDHENKILREEKLQWRREQKSNKEWEKQARENAININVEEVEKEWQRTVGPQQVKEIADHYGVFEHLFQHAYFTPWIPLQVFYDSEEDYVNPVHHGNILPSGAAVHEPQVQFPSSADDLWTLVFTNLDGHLLDTESEYLHWFIGNIRGGDLNTGEILCDYMPPLPWRGTGYHRLVFVLYKQDAMVDFLSLKRPLPCHCLKERTFKTFDFYKAYQDVLTPAGISFFQCTWDTNLTDFVHKVLKMNEPVFEYNEPPIYSPLQEVVPHRKPFNIYLDQYRDPKDIKKEILLKRLQTVHPFEKEPPMPKYPCLRYPEGRIFSWQKDDVVKEQLRLGKFRDLRPHSAYPQEDNQGEYKYPS